MSRGCWTTPGRVNRNGQMNLGLTEPERNGNDHGQRVYVMRCLDCELDYGANGSDIFQRRCPFHQSGKPGLPLEGNEPNWPPVEPVECP